MDFPLDKHNTDFIFLQKHINIFMPRYHLDEQFICSHNTVGDKDDWKWDFKI